MLGCVSFWKRKAVANAEASSLAISGNCPTQPGADAAGLKCRKLDASRRSKQAGTVLMPCENSLADSLDSLVPAA